MMKRIPCPANQKRFHSHGWHCIPDINKPSNLSNLISHQFEGLYKQIVSKLLCLILQKDPERSRAFLSLNFLKFFHPEQFSDMRKNRLNIHIFLNGY